MYDTSKSTWLNPNIEYLFDNEIIEYDIQDAGFSLIKQYKLLPDTKIRELEILGKGLDRHIAVGRLQGNDKEFSKSLNTKFAEIRKIFISMNGLDDNDIISVKKDAIYTIGRCKKSKFDSIIFREKNIYTSYIRFPNINNIELYYSINGIDIKGMSDSAVNRHRLYLLDFINKYIPYIESKNVFVKKYLRNFINEYKFHELEDEFYVEFNAQSNKINPIYNYQNILIPLTLITMKELE